MSDKELTNEHPVLFSGPMVRAIRENRKTQTRRTRGLGHVNIEPNNWRTEQTDDGWTFFALDGPAFGVVRCPYGTAGDRLWVREPWRVLADYDFRKPRELVGDWIEFFYEAEGPLTAEMMHGEPGRLRPGMFMPCWASRETLEVVSVRPERLQAITEGDACAEGCSPSEVTAATISDFQISDSSPELKKLSRVFGEGSFTAKFDFMMLWDSINGKTVPWSANPWVWVVSFRRLATS